MTTVDQAAIERFMHGQVVCWNAHDKAGLMALYREMASEHLEIGYAGRTEVSLPPGRRNTSSAPQGGESTRERPVVDSDGWFIIEEMYDKHNAQFRLEVVETIINGNEAAVHHRNCIIGSDAVIESIETYRFEAGRLSVVYFLKPPAAQGVDLNQFRGFAA